MMTLVKFDELYLSKSFDWLNDSEIQALTDGPLTLTREMQQKWYEEMREDSTYVIWGIDWDGVRIGACGIKHIDFINKTGEYWGYIGEKQYWGGKGHILMNMVIQKAQEVGLDKLCLFVLSNNERAFHLYESEGFVVESRNGDKIYMSKQI